MSSRILFGPDNYTNVTRQSSGSWRRRLKRDTLHDGPLGVSQKPPRRFGNAKVPPTTTL
jgi:hypothetical protein